MTENDLLDAARKPSYAGVARAAAKIAEILPQTPLLPLDVDGRTIWCKAEMLQPVGAFKIRGAWHRLTDLSDSACQIGVVGVSSGNHAQGVAWAAKKLGISAIIIMPSNAPRIKIAATRALGAEVVFYDRQSESRDDIAAALVAKTGRTLVHAFADPWVIEGQGTAGFEIVDQLKIIGVDGPLHIVACCGGGGLAAGLSLACPDARISIAEPEGWDDVLRSLDTGHIVPVVNPAFPTPCDALQTLSTYPLNYAILQERGVTGACVTPDEIRAAMRLVFDRLHLVVEPGGAAALAAVLAGKIGITDTTVVTLSGGNVDWDTFVTMIGD